MEKNRVMLGSFFLNHRGYPRDMRISERDIEE
jgi:hypothetical protein